MKVKIGKIKIGFIWVFLGLLALFLMVLFTLLYILDIDYMNVFFGSFMVLLLIVLAYYWMDSRKYYNNLGRIRRTFYTLYLLVMSIGFISGDIDYKDWGFLIQMTVLVVFADLAVFQNPNILKLFNAEFKHEDEIRETLSDSKKTIIKNAKKVEKFTQIIQSTDVHFSEIPIPATAVEYKEQMEGYFNLYSSTFEFKISLFLFESPIDEEQKKKSIQNQINNISQRHGMDLSNKQQEETMNESFSSGETIILREEELIAIPYFGDFYSLIVTVEAKDVPVDGIDASHISNMMVIFDWYMTDVEEIEELALDE